MVKTPPHTKIPAAPFLPRHLQLLVDAVIAQQVVRHAGPVGLHGMPLRGGSGEKSQAAYFWSEAEGAAAAAAHKPPTARIRRCRDAMCAASRLLTHASVKTSFQR